jgi:hypothetical protein
MNEDLFIVNPNFFARQGVTFILEGVPFLG